MRKTLIGLALLLGLPAAFADVSGGGGGVSSAAPLINNKGTSLPAQCAVGQLFFKSDATAGQNIYECAAANTWTQQSGGGGGVVAPVTLTSADSPYTIVDDGTTSIQIYLVNTSGGAVTVNEPASPTNGKITYIKKITSDTNILTVGRNGKNIEGAAANLTTSSAQLPGYQLVYSTTGTNWASVSASPSFSVTAAQTSTSYALAGTDAGLTVRYTGTGAGAWTAPVATTLGSAFYTCVENRESGAASNLVITPTTSTINGAATLTIKYGKGACIVSDGSNYFANEYVWLSTYILPVANGGSGSASPAIVAGTNVTVSGTWPNQTINSSSSVSISSSVYGSLPSAAGNTGVLYRVTDVGATSAGTLYVSDGTRWKPQSGCVALKSLGARQTMSGTGETILLQYTFPATFIHLYDHVIISNLTTTKTGTSETATTRIRLGTAGTTADTAIASWTTLTSTTILAGIDNAFRLESATTIRRTGSGAIAYYGSSTSAYGAAVTISNVSNALVLSISNTMSSTVETFGLEDAEISFCSTTL